MKQKHILWAFVFGSRIAQICTLSQLSLCTHNPDHSLYNYFSISVRFFSPNGPSILLPARFTKWSGLVPVPSLRPALLLHITCVRFCCTWRASCVAAFPKKQKNMGDKIRHLWKMSSFKVTAAMFLPNPVVRAGDMNACCILGPSDFPEAYVWRFRYRSFPERLLCCLVTVA